MLIGIDAHVLGKNIGGVERFVDELVRRLPLAASEHRFVVFVTRSYLGTLRPSTDDRVRYVAVVSGSPLIQRLVLLPWLVRRHRVDALIVQRLAPWLCGACRLIVVVHDLIPIKFADAYRGLSNRLVRLLTRNTVARAALTLVPTETIRREVVAYAGRAIGPVRAFYNGVDAGRFHDVATRAAAPNETPYFLSVGAIERRKDLETLLAALHVLRDLPTLRVVLVGPVRDAGYHDEFRRRTIDLGLQDRVSHPGFVSEPELIRLYRDAVGFVTTSLDEGFNIPPLEAMACGTPVVCSDIAVHRELFDGAASFFATRSAAGLASAMRAVVEGGPDIASQVDAGRRKVATYTWDATAARVAAAIRSIDLPGA